jgi:hypothetical protein
VPVAVSLDGELWIADAKRWPLLVAHLDANYSLGLVAHLDCQAACLTGDHVQAHRAANRGAKAGQQIIKDLRMLCHITPNTEVSSGAKTI